MHNPKNSNSIRKSKKDKILSLEEREEYIKKYYGKKKKKKREIKEQHILVHNFEDFTQEEQNCINLFCDEEKNGSIIVDTSRIKVIKISKILKKTFLRNTGFDYVSFWFVRREDFYAILTTNFLRIVFFFLIIFFAIKLELGDSSVLLFILFGTVFHYLIFEYKDNLEKELSKLFKKLVKKMNSIKKEKKIFIGYS